MINQCYDNRKTQCHGFGVFSDIEFWFLIAQEALIDFQLSCSCLLQLYINALIQIHY